MLIAFELMILGCFVLTNTCIFMSFTYHWIHLTSATSVPSKSVCSVSLRSLLAYRTQLYYRWLRKTACGVDTGVDTGVRIRTIKVAVSKLFAMDIETVCTKVQTRTQAVTLATIWIMLKEQNDNLNERKEGRKKRHTTFLAWLEAFMGRIEKNQ